MVNHLLTSRWDVHVPIATGSGGSRRVARDCDGARQTPRRGVELFMRQISHGDGRNSRNWGCGAGLSALLACAVAVAGCSGANQQTTRAGQWQPTGVDRPATAHTPPEPVRTAAPAAQPPALNGPRAVPRVAGVYKVGKPYVINGVTYVPAEDPGYDKVGMASWYGTDFHGKQTANGELFDMHGISAAHPTLPLPSYVHVTNLRNGRTMLVRVNDRGPYKPGRIVDLSHRTAQLLGFDGQGVTEIRVRYAGPAPLDPKDDRRERQHLAAQPWSRSVRAPWSPAYALGMGTAATAQIQQQR